MDALKDAIDHHLTRLHADNGWTAFPDQSCAEKLSSHSLSRGVIHDLLHGDGSGSGGDGDGGGNNKNNNNNGVTDSPTAPAAPAAPAAPGTAGPSPPGTDKGTSNPTTSPTSAPTTQAPTKAPTPPSTEPVCEDHPAAVAAVASVFGVSSCADVLSFCANSMAIPPALVPKDDDPRMQAVSPALKAELRALMEDTSKPMQLNQVLTVACPITCEAGCAAPTPTPAPAPTPAASPFPVCMQSCENISLLSDDRVMADKQSRCKFGNAFLQAAAQSGCLRQCPKESQLKIRQLFEGFCNTAGGRQ